MFRLFLVYVTLFFVILCASSGLFGSPAMAATKVQTARVSVESFDLKKNLKEVPLFSNYHYDPGYFKGDFKQTSQELAKFIEARKNHIERLKSESSEKSGKINEEQKRLMALKPDAKWGMELYANMERKAFVDQDLREKIAGWDNTNFVEVKYTEDKHSKKFYITALKIHRKDRGQREPTVASIP